MIRGIIFDLDGTLLDSREQRVNAWREALRLHGVMVTPDELRPLIGLPGIALASKFSDDPVSIENEEERLFTDMLPEISLFPDVEGTIAVLKSIDIKVAIVTSSRREVLNRMKLPSDIIVCIDDVSKGKPDTEPYELAARLMNVSPSELLVVGDAENDMIPCLELDSICVFYRNDRQMKSENAHFSIDAIREVLTIVKEINGT